MSLGAWSNVPYILGGDAGNGPGIYNSENYGVVADGNITDNAPILNELALKISSTLPRFSYSGGAWILLPPGFVGTKSSLNIYSGIHYIGCGPGITAIQPINAGFVPVKFFTSPDGIQENCFYGGLHHLTVAYNSYFAPPGDFTNCVEAITNPINTTATDDPDFDPYNIMENVECRGATGHGFYASGRSGLRSIGCLYRYNYGRGCSPSFDTILSSCNWGFNGLSGLFIEEASITAQGKSYNNGNKVPTWTSGQNWFANQSFVNFACFYQGHLYYPLMNLTNDTTPPSSDPTKWRDMGEFGDWGTGVFLNGLSATQLDINVNCQENSTGAFYLLGCGPGVRVSGVAADSNNSETSGVGNVALDGTNGAIVNVAIAGASSSYDLALINGSANNDVVLTDDGPIAQLTEGSTVGSNRVYINGAQVT